VLLFCNDNGVNPYPANVENIYPTRCNVTQFTYIWKLLYMFRVALPPIIRSAYNCIYSIWYLSHRYCYLPLSWKSWNRFECTVGGVGHPQYTHIYIGARLKSHTDVILVRRMCLHGTTFRRSYWPLGLRRVSAAARLLGLRVRIQPTAWISVCWECCVLAGRDLCKEQMLRSEKAIEDVCVCVCVCACVGRY
jgi:hypothetical protein